MLAESTDTILVIDDDTIIRRSVVKLLSREGYNVIEACSGKQGVEKFNDNTPDLVLLDVMMPEMNGYETCKALRQIKIPRTVPVIMLTGLDDVDAVSYSFDAGATDFISKPINWVLLVQRVKYALRSRDIYLELQRNQVRLTNAQKLAKLGYWELNPDTMSMTCSLEMCYILGCENNNLELLFSDFLLMVNEDERDFVREAVSDAITKSKPYVLDHHLQRRDGSLIIVQNQAEIETDNAGRLVSVVGTVQDISDRKEAELLIEYHKTYDTLTELPNKINFSSQLEHTIKVASDKNTMQAVYFIGLDRFKLINDTLGHATGDKLLKEISERLSDYSKEGFIIGRFSGDVFSVISPQLQDINEANLVAQKFIDDVSKKIIIDEHELFVTASIGITLFPLENESVGTLLKAADSAMFNAKTSGGNRYLYYDANLNLEVTRKMTMESDLRKAIVNNEFVLYYQPQVNTETRRIVGMEALIRWMHPEKGLISPLDFIPVAEESGLIIPIGEWVLKQACIQTAIWVDTYGPLCVGVNLSARQFTDNNLSEKIETILKETNLAPENLDMEITESIVLNDMQETIAMLQQFRDRGISTSMDDFGTGYSSLSYLHQLPIDTLKIDRAFIKDISPASANSGAIARAIIAMAHSLGMNVIAEGVETEYQYSYMKRYGCDEIQGYLFSPPVPAEHFESMLADVSVTFAHSSNG
ncbi:MAG: EAL domain-containing protein [Gammaproteobacteria bacterium]|nr:EAL domain-containing protein [Gammaproteobacteria bacterium]